MWKFVQRRFKDTLNVRQTWTCGRKSSESSYSSIAKNVNDCNEPYKELLIWRYGSSRYEERESSQNDRYFHNVFQTRSSLINWVAAILCGFSVGPYIVRRHRLRHLDEKFKLYLFQNQRKIALGKNYCLVHWAKSVYEKSFVPSDKKQNSCVALDKKRNELFFNGGTSPVLVNNEHTECKTTSDQNRVIDQAIDNLMATLGHIEFKLGLQNIQANEHRVAVSHFKLATTHRHAGATFNLGVCYELGIGIDKNMKSAMECYRAAAALGHNKAMYNLGVFYARGEGGLAKNREAASACLLAADTMGLKSARTVFDIPDDMRKPDDEISFKTTKMAIENVHEAHQRSHLFG